MRRILNLQFGNVYQRRQKGFTVLSRIYSHPAYCWLDAVDECGGKNIEDARLEGYVSSRDPATLSLGLPDGEYEITLTAYTKDKGHASYGLTANGKPAIPVVELIAGKVFRQKFIAHSRRNRLNLRFTPQPGGDFIVNTIEVRGQHAVELLPLFRQAPPVAMPDRLELNQQPALDPLKALEKIGDWFLTHRQSNGYLGDNYGPGESFWYTASMPLRTLIAAYQLLNRADYLKAAFDQLDQFVDEQLPNGAWEAVLRGRATRLLPRAEVQRILREERLPMSDVGSVVSSLAVAIPVANGARQRRYTKSLRLFCDDWAPRFQRRNGAFDDGVWPQPTAIYTCATAIEAATFALAYRVTGEARYLDVSKRAIRYLLKDWRSDGRMLGRAPHWQVHNHKPFVMENIYFGDQWYYDEGFITTWHHIKDRTFRTQVGRALHNRVHGSAGLLAAQNRQTWWPVQDLWNNAKSLGMVQTLLFAQRHGESSPRLKRALENSSHILANPTYSRRLGVMATDSTRPILKHGIRSWAGLRMEATGFAGMSLAETIRPGILYLA